MSNKYTRQGVLNLDHIKGKSVGRKLPEPPPDMFKCAKHNFEDFSEPSLGLMKCSRCGLVCDWDGKSF
jgi:hypothetical protein